MRAQWSSPLAMVECFSANEYVASCGVYKCDVSGMVWFDSNGDGQIDSKPIKVQPCDESITLGDDYISNGQFLGKGNNKRSVYVWYADNRYHASFLSKVVSTNKS